MILRKVISVLIAAIFFTMLNAFAFAQVVKSSINFNNTWLIKPYYDKLVAADSLHPAFNDSLLFIRYIYISSNFDSLIVCSLNEGNNESFEVQNENKLRVTKSQFINSPYTISLVTKNYKNFLALIEDGKVDTVFYVPLGDKYKTAGGFSRFINDKFFTGTYVSDDNKYNITFHSDGSLEGFSDFNKYVVDVFYSSFIHHDLLYFQKIITTDFNKPIKRKVADYRAFNWKKKGSEIWLYNLSDVPEIGEVTTLFTKLKRVN